jgi:nucleotide-binding universal stress UspA family protein
MGGTILCAVTDTAEGRAAAQLAGALSERLGSRLVLAHAVEVAPGRHESPLAQQRQGDAGRALEEIAHGLASRNEVELRVGFGDRVELLAQIAAEEGADLIVLGSRARGLRGRQLACTLARELEAATPAPVLVAPPQTRKRAERRLAVAEMGAAR